MIWFEIYKMLTSFDVLTYYCDPVYKGVEKTLQIQLSSIKLSA